MVLVVFFEDDELKRNLLLDHLQAKFPEITSLMYCINRKANDSIFDQEILPYAGQDHIMEQMEDLQFKIGPKSFFQTNSVQALELYRKVREFAGLTGGEVVYDLYSGTGTIGLFLARKAGKVVGIEYIDEAIQDARVNAKLNNIGNAEFFSGDIKDLLTEEFVREQGQPDVLITDPPRAGMHKDVVDVILSVSPDRIVYVSCNPSTQSRDLQLLSEKYKVLEIQPYDMFPQTYHVENIVVLERM
jgi:23S rRNA (uracil1939-C5)-methyltransferase